jgi:hypothetical protein
MILIICAGKSWHVLARDRYEKTPLRLQLLSSELPVDAGPAWSDSSGMVVIRTLLAALIAMSVVMLPPTGEPIVSPSPVEVTMADQVDMSCCPCCDIQDNFKSTACTFKCITLAGAVLPAMTVTLRYLADGPPLSFVGDTLHGLERPPPTHPPPL